jgi:uncharacterized protein (TIRG00374 family)
VLPARLGELVRAYILSRREQVAASSVLSTIVLERVLEMISLALFFSAAVWAVGLAGIQKWALLGLFGCLLLFFLIFLLQRRHQWLVGLAARIPWPNLRERGSDMVEKFLDGLAVVRAPGRLLAVVGLGVAVYLVEGASYWTVARAFGLEISYAQSLFVLCFIFIGMTIPATVGNIGALQFFCGLGLSFFGVGASQAFVYSVAINALLYVPALLGLIILPRYGSSLRRLKAELQAGGPE